jgi:hypothetical protein
MYLDFFHRVNRLCLVAKLIPSRVCFAYIDQLTAGKSLEHRAGAGGGGEAEKMGVWKDAKFIL